MGTLRSSPAFLVQAQWCPSRVTQPVNANNLSVSNCLCSSLVWQSPIRGTKSPKLHCLWAPVVQTLIFARVNLSARVRRWRTVQRTSPAGEALPQQSPGFERIWNSSDDTEGAGSGIVMAMLFNTVILPSISGINVPSSRSVLFMCVRVRAEVRDMSAG